MGRGGGAGGAGLDIGSRNPTIFLQGRKLLTLPVCFPAHPTLLKMGLFRKGRICSKRVSWCGFLALPGTRGT